MIASALEDLAQSLLEEGKALPTPMVTHEQQAVLRELVWVNRDRLDGEPCFKRTRVPVQALIDHFEGKWHS